MAITSLIPLISANSIALIIALFFLISPSYYCSDHKQYPSLTCRGLVVEEKARLGSTPPSCHNKCNLCHPCTAVQVPTMPSHHRVDPSSVKENPPCSDDSSSADQYRYSNYKPLKWKCRCAGQFYNP